MHPPARSSSSVSQRADCEYGLTVRTPPGAACHNSTAEAETAGESRSPPSTNPPHAAPRPGAPARSNRARRAGCVASVVPLPGSARPIASARQFIEFAVNMPEQDPQVGQADSSIASSRSSDTDGSAEAIIGSMRSSLAPPARPAGAPASIGPPETNTVGMFSRMVAISMPGASLSQLEMQSMAYAQGAW